MFLTGQTSKCTSRGGGGVDALEPAAIPGLSPLVLCADSKRGTSWKRGTRQGEGHGGPGRGKLEMEGKLSRGGAWWGRQTGGPGGTGADARVWPTQGPTRCLQGPSTGQAH